MNKPLSYLRKSPSQKRAAATFDAILDAAAHILREWGHKKLTTNAVANRAGVSIGSLYQYFPAKQAIVRALVARELAWAERIRPVCIDGDGSKRAIIRAIVDWHFDVRARDPALSAALQALANETLLEEERSQVTALRQARVKRTVARLTGAAERTHAAFIVDTCLNAIADETMRRHPERLTSEPFRREVTALLVGYLEPTD
jgi:AcrR family transcriptional regulator